MKTVLRIAVSIIFFAAGLYGLYRAVRLPTPGTEAARYVDGGAWTYAWLPTLVRAAVFLVAGLLSARFGRLLLGDDAAVRRLKTALLVIACLFGVRGTMQVFAGGPPPYATYARWGWPQYIPELLATLAVAVAAVIGAILFGARHPLGRWMLLVLSGLGTLGVIASVISSAVEPNLSGWTVRAVVTALAAPAFSMGLLAVVWLLRPDAEDDAVALTARSRPTALNL